MALINLRRILTTDSIAQQVDKTNYNFEQIMLAGGGPVGMTGATGVGIPGGPGPVGAQGPAGAPGEEWYLGTTDPPSLNIQTPAVGAQTIWLNVTSGTFFQWNGTTWVNKGAFTVSNFWSKTNDIIFNSEYTNQLVLSDEENGITTAPSVSNDDGFLLKINSTGGAHIILTNGVGNDADGVTLRLISTDFFLDSVSANINFNITSQKGLIFSSVTDTTFSSNAGYSVSAVGNIGLTSTTGGVTVNSNQQLAFYSSIFQTYIQSKVGIGLGPLFNPTEVLQVGSVAAPANILIVRGNGLNDGNLILQRNSYQMIVDTEPLTSNQTVHIPNLSGALGILRDFNTATYDSSWVKTENHFSFGSTPNSGGAYTFKNQMIRGTGFYQVGAGAILEQAASNNYGAEYFLSTYYKIVGNIVLFKWDMLVKTYSTDGSTGNEEILGISFPLPYDTNFLSTAHIQAASQIETKTADNFSVIRSRATHQGSLIEVTSGLSSKEFVFQVSPTRNTSSSFTGSKCIVLFANTNFQYFTGNYYNLSGEATLDLVDLVNTTDTVSVLSDLSNYLTGTPQIAPYSTSVPYRGCIVYDPLDGLTKFDSNGKGISGDVIGYQICNGQGTTRDFRGRTPYQYDATNPLFNVLGLTGGASTHVLTISEMPNHTHPYNVRAFGGAQYNNTTSTGHSTGDLGETTGATGGGESFNIMSPYITALWIMNIINPNFGSTVTTTTLPAGIYADITIINLTVNPNPGTTYSNSTGDILVSFYSDPAGTIPYSVSGLNFNYQEETNYSNVANPSLNFIVYNNFSKLCTGNSTVLISGQILSETYYSDNTQTTVTETNNNTFVGSTGSGYVVI